jgi:23S rRNA (uracil1939-C5)-methyltransferase
MTTVSIERIATGGDGVGRLPDGMTVFVPRTAPGDRVRVAVQSRRRRWARGRALEVERPGPDRTAPACPHYDGDACGGCQLQHLALGAQHTAKRAIVRDVLARIGGREIDAPNLVPAPAPWRYRSKITLAAGEGGTFGYRRYDHPGTVFELRDCHIALPILMSLLERVRAGSTRLPDGATHLVLRLDRDGATHLLVRGGDTPWDGTALGEALAEPAVTVWWEPAGGAPRVVAGSPDAFPALAFLQTNPDLAARIRADAHAWIAAEPPGVVWDLYGGVGDGARELAATGADVWSVEADRSAVAWAKRQPGPAPSYVQGRVEEVLPRLPQPKAIVLNPPRAGAAPRVIRTIGQLAGRVARVAYVSCDPATLARDLARLGGYRLAAVLTYDLFPQTAHVETLALLEAA